MGITLATCRILSGGLLDQQKVIHAKIHEVLRLHFEHGRSKREIARIIKVSPLPFSITWHAPNWQAWRRPCTPIATTPLLSGCCSLPASHHRCGGRRRPSRPVHNEPRRKDVTLELWQEYKAEQPDGYQYSAFCEHYRRWRQQLTTSMRQTHPPGERLQSQSFPKSLSYLFNSQAGFPLKESTGHIQCQNL